jgi:hypothetical protein
MDVESFNGKSREIVFKFFFTVFGLPLKNTHMEQYVLKRSGTENEIENIMKNNMQFIYNQVKCLLEQKITTH